MRRSTVLRPMWKQRALKAERDVEQLKRELQAMVEASNQALKEQDRKAAALELELRQELDTLRRRYRAALSG